MEETCAAPLVSAEAHGFLFTPSNLHPPPLPENPRPPSVSFPGSLLQARGGRVSLHVSPEMSHHLQHTRICRLPGSFTPCTLLLSPSAAVEGEVNKRDEGVVFACVLNRCMCAWVWQLVEILYAWWRMQSFCAAQLSLTGGWEALRPALHRSGAQRRRWLSHSCQPFSSNKDKGSSN